MLLEGCGFAWLLESRTSWLAGCFLCLVGCGFAWCENFVGAVGTSAAVWLVHVTSAAVWLVHVLARLANKALDSNVSAVIGGWVDFLATLSSIRVLVHVLARLATQVGGS